MDRPDTPDQPLIAEDLLLLLFDPRSGTIAGEGTLFYTLGGAVLAELALDERIDLGERNLVGGQKVIATGDAPTDPVLLDAWQQIGRKPRSVQTVLAMIGPELRAPLLDRTVERGHVRRERRRLLGLIPSTRLSDGGTPRRTELLAAVRPVLLDRAEPEPRVATLAALLSASGSLPTLYRDIPWSGDVYRRGKELEHGDWGARATSAAVARTAAAVAASSIAVATSTASGSTQ